MIMMLVDNINQVVRNARKIGKRKISSKYTKEYPMVERK